MSLADLEARLAHDLALLNWGEPDWLVPTPHPDGHVHDVIIIGGGQSGLGAAFGLMRERIGNILILDENPAGFEGPWDTYARMRTLRTPKHLSTIEYGLPSLSFRAWYEAQHSRAAWDTLDKIPRGEWMDYLRWYRRTLKLPVRNEARVALIEPRDGIHFVKLDDGEVLRARKVVLATGIQGGGQWHTPAIIKAVPRDLYAHSSEPIDFGWLAGGRIAVLGGGASAFDNATAALEAGVGKVHVFMRRKDMPRINPIRFMERAGMTRRFPALDDGAKYAVMASFFDRNQPPTTDMFERAATFEGFHLHLGSPWTSVEQNDDGAITVTTPNGRFTYDFLILSTGLVTDPALRPELALVESRIARWGDRHVADDKVRNPLIEAHPYLGPGFQFLPREPEDAAALHGLFAFNYSALVSLGLSAAALSGLDHALPRLVSAVADQLFLDDRDEILAGYFAYAEPEFLAEWRPRGTREMVR
ncbi:cation diffusion facilitator CzcD-associated flavoprotein CzcO [Sphingomonas zeicaulis]|uniref:NAD(P)-binding domain-containing protein n=1 Tax=Sphingomonas zeicaulis TaxID=1632740 RepID=UPI003D211A51